MGAVRLRRIARHLPAFGYRLIVLTSAEEGVIPSGLNILRARATDLTRIYRKLARVDRPSDTPERKIQTRNISLTSALNRWFMIPDKHVSWLWPAIREARSCLRSNKVDAIFASLEPRTNLLVAARLAREFELPCVMEYRDLWTGSPYYHLAQPTILHRWNPCLDREARLAAGDARHLRIERLGRIPVTSIRRYSEGPCSSEL